MSKIVHSSGVGGQKWVKFGPRSYWMTAGAGRGLMIYERDIWLGTYNQSVREILYIFVDFFISGQIMPKETYGKMALRVLWDTGKLTVYKAAQIIKKSIVQYIEG